MEIISFDGRVDENSEYIHFTVKGGSKQLIIGDCVWCDETELEIADDILDDEELWEEFCNAMKEYGAGKLLREIKGFIMRIAEY